MSPDPRAMQVLRGPEDGACKRPWILQAKATGGHARCRLRYRALRATRGITMLRLMWVVEVWFGDPANAILQSQSVAFSSRTANVPKVAPYFGLITSESIFEARSSSEKPPPFSELPNLAGGSKWGREHLFAARVIRCEAQSNLLPIYSRDFNPTEAQYAPEIVRFLEGPSMEHLAQSKHFLVRFYGYSLGLAWAALAAFKGPASRRRVVSSGRVDNEADGSEIKSDSGLVGYVDGGHDGFMPLERETVQLVSCVFRHILYSTQTSSLLPAVVEFRDTRMRHAASTPMMKRKLIAVDDGGLCMRQEINGSSVLIKNQVATLEAKQRFQLLEDGKRVISDECFAQMTCEAIAARLADPFKELGHESVIIANAIQHYVCFLQFEITDAYLEEFDSEAPSSFLHVNSTPWFDLGSREGREHLLSNLCALIQWARI